jgi:hypothetical protein
MQSEPSDMEVALTRSIRCMALFGALAAMALAAPSANAGVLVSSATDCADQSTAQVFKPWLDPLSYTVVPGGTLEDGAAGWSLNGASVVSGNEPWEVHRDGESKSLRIPGGKSATTDTICVGLDHPVMRFFAKSSGDTLLGSLASTLTVEVLFEDSAGAVHALPIGVVLPGSRWSPTLPYPVIANLLPLLPGEQTPVRFRFKAVGGSAWQIDDVYVDPRSRG